jgi:TPR repeat protein
MESLSIVQCSLGWCYDTGSGVPKDEQEGVRWYTLAASQGYSMAISNLGPSFVFSLSPSLSFFLSLSLSTYTFLLSLSCSILTMNRCVLSEWDRGGRE